MAPGAPRQLPPACQRAVFISDLHLSESLPRTTAAFLRLLARPQGDALFILGDLFEAWVGDDMLDQPYEAGVAAAITTLARQQPVYVMRGNRDFLLGARFFRDTGCIELPDPVAFHGFGQTVLLSHGDALCLDDKAYQQFRAQVRQPAWQAALLARPFAERMAIAQQMRGASRAQAREPETYADVDPAMAQDWLAEAGTQLLVHGHTHRPGSDAFDGWQRHVLCDWELDHGNGNTDRGELMLWDAQGWHRQALPA